MTGTRHKFRCSQARALRRPTLEAEADTQAKLVLEAEPSRAKELELEVALALGSAQRCALVTTAGSGRSSGGEQSA